MERHLEQLIESYRNVGMVEFEIRFGIHHNKFFDTDISKKNYESLKKTFVDCKEWVQTYDTLLNDYFDKNKLRLTIDEHSYEFCIKKKQLFRETWKIADAPLDFRISVASEEYHQPSEFDNGSINYSRSKERLTFQTRYYNFDLTLLSQNSGDDNDDDSNEKYEFEIELNFETMNADQRSSAAIAKSILHKVYGVLSIIEPGEYDKKPHSMINYVKR
tara:strand:- start:534 stop:1184 length:651 start_codon:yes stop_codon:yes gene_type:complete